MPEPSYGYVYLCKVAVSSLLCDETAGWSREADDPVWELEFWHVSRVPPHFRFCGKLQDQLGLLRGGDKVGHIGVHWIETIEHVHGIVVRGGG